MLPASFAACVCRGASAVSLRWSGSGSSCDPLETDEVTRRGSVPAAVKGRAESLLGARLLRASVSFPPGRQARKL